MSIAPMEQEDDSIFAEIEAREKAEKLEEEQVKALTNNIKSVMSTKQGRAVMAWALGFSGLDVSISSRDALVMSNLSGRRDVGLAIRQRLLADCPELVAEMEKEQRNG